MHVVSRMSKDGQIFTLSANKTHRSKNLIRNSELRLREPRHQVSSLRTGTFPESTNPDSKPRPENQGDLPDCLYRLSISDFFLLAPRSTSSFPAVQRSSSDERKTLLRKVGCTFIGGERRCVSAIVQIFSFVVHYSKLIVHYSNLHSLFVMIRKSRFCCTYMVFQQCSPLFRV
ncbi:hypothetical protein AVEN_197881-1 [Araneus ventricosus]|uniref:Uncharacterized protein n=1 Tax=Araneus ventricosus TaxID=182803 RepID=A0A4Y2X7H7_ARAVE|nr:hypothetical protein AVEN_197881-1 [Araneus ventricosus]